MAANSSIKLIREKIRKNYQIYKSKQRFQQNDSFRLGLGEIKLLVDQLENITEKDVHGLCVRIKRRKHAGPDDLIRLSQAFLQSNENIITFSKTPGALQIIVKELTGQDSKQQINAAETLCNLSLGDEVVCEKISTQAGSYLITFLESIDFRLKQTSLWTIINIVSTSGKGLETLLAMGITSKCLDLFYCNNCSDDLSLIEDIAICLNQIFEYKKNEKIELPNIIEFFEQMTKLPLEDRRNEFILKIIFNSSLIKSEYILNDEQLQYIANLIIKNVLDGIGFVEQDSILRILYDIRTLSNIICAYKIKFVNIFEEICLSNNTNLINFMNLLFSFQNEDFTKEILWLLKNLISVMNSETKVQFIRKLKVTSTI